MSGLEDDRLALREAVLEIGCGEDRVLAAPEIGMAVIQVQGVQRESQMIGLLSAAQLEDAARLA
jgi:hypothetical protein